MRVLHVVEVSHGGVVTYVRELARLQVSMGLDVHVIAPESAGEFAGNVHNWAPRRRSPRSLIAARRSLGIVMAKVAPDVVHLHSFFPGILGRTLRRSGVVAYQPHSWAFEAAPAVVKPLVVLWERIALRWTHVVLVNCESEAAEGRRHGLRCPVRVVGLPIDLLWFRPQELPMPLPVAGLADRSLVVCVGRISEQKGQAELVRAWEASPIKDACLILVGPGDTQQLRLAAPDTFGRSVLHVGSQSDVRPYLANAVVSVMPSRYEGQSVAMAEAMACGVPVIITDVNGAREAVLPANGSAAGSVVPVGDIDGLLEEARRRVSDKHLRRRESLIARANAVKSFESSTVERRVMTAYEFGVSELASKSFAREGR